MDGSQNLRGIGAGQAPFWPSGGARAASDPSRKPHVHKSCGYAKVRPVARKLAESASKQPMFA